MTYNVFSGTIKPYSVSRKKFTFAISSSGEFLVGTRLSLWPTKLTSWSTVKVLPVNSSFPPFPQIDIIGTVVIVWRARGKLSGLFCAVLCATIVHSELHTHMNIVSDIG